MIAPSAARATSSNRSHLWVTVFLPCLALYVLTAAPGPLWQDAGEVQLRVLLGEWRDPASLARTHVLFYLLAALAKLVPVGSVAYQANLLSALFGAITVANVAWLVGRVTHRPVAAAATALLLGGSHTLWQYSTMAEVMTLFTALLSAELCLLWWFVSTRRVGWLYALAFCNGLAFADHNLALLSCAAYVGMLVVRHRSLPRPIPVTLALSAVFWLLGAAPLLFLVLQQWIDSRDFAGTLTSLLFGGYENRVLNFSRLGVLGLRVVGYLGLNFPTPLLAAMPVGWWVARRRMPRGFWLTLSALFVVHFAFAARYDVADQYSFMIPTYVLLAVFAGCGIAYLIDTTRRSWCRPVILCLAAFGPIAYAVAPPLAARLPASWVPIPTRSIPYRDPYAWFLRPWRTGYDGAARYAREVLDALPEDAVLLADSTLATPLLYVQHADELAPGVLINTPLRRRENAMTSDQAVAFARSGRLFVTADQAPYCPAWILERATLYRNGPVFRVEMTSGRE